MHVTCLTLLRSALAEFRLPRFSRAVLGELEVIMLLASCKTEMLGLLARVSLETGEMIQWG